MLGIILIYFIGKSYFKLAELFNKSKWGFAVLGVASYYAGSILGAMLIGMGMEIFGSTTLDESDDLLLGLLGVPFGLLACWGLYQILKRNWLKNKEHFDPEILDAEILHKDHLE